MGQGNIPRKGKIICKGPVAEKNVIYSRDMKEAGLLISTKYSSLYQNGMIYLCVLSPLLITSECHDWARGVSQSQGWRKKRNQLNDWRSKYSKMEENYDCSEPKNIATLSGAAQT